MNWLRKFLVGRYGFDQLTVGLLTAYFLFAVIMAFIPWAGKRWLVNIVFLIVFLAVLARILSRNIDKRRMENEKFLSLMRPLSGRIRRQVQRARGKRTHRYYKCRSCRQELRVPKGKGKIKIRCPKCGREFVRKT